VGWWVGFPASPQHVEGPRLTPGTGYEEGIGTIAARYQGVGVADKLLVTDEREVRKISDKEAGSQARQGFLIAKAPARLASAGIGWTGRVQPPASQAGSPYASGEWTDVKGDGKRVKRRGFWG
jgi:hypothetical protein